MSGFRCQDLATRFPDTRHLNSLNSAVAAPQGPLFPSV
ncbi:hypothetical protein D1AOALGA4SA_2518 [Olavius algarvensis Delta 1 endosymbiont]|nr:hypothetical protein D1AOALGA4SA_2518 [Olavius algarvensis Delta 1 endosymbiont]